MFILEFFWVFLILLCHPRQLRVSKEQEHFLVAPQGLACSEVTAASLVSTSPPSPGLPWRELPHLSPLCPPR